MIALAAAVAAAALGASDLSLLQQQLPQIHPAAQHREFAAAVDDLRAKLPGLDENETVVGFMRVVASLGDRNGHTGIFPLDPGNRRSFHEYPVLPYEFPEGPVVVRQLGGSDLVGARIESVGGLPIAQVLERLRPLVPHDNESSLRARRPMYLMSAEVLAGLGIEPRFGFVLRNGAKVERTLPPVSAAAYSRAFDGFRVLPQVRAQTRISTLAGGRVVYFVYNSTFEFVGDDAARLLRLAATPKVRRIVVDLRNNPGGDNHTYPVLVDALHRLSTRHKQVVVLAGRVTFSAAANFLADLETTTRFLLVGEDSGGAPNLYGDATPLDLPQTGLRVEVATVWWVKSRLGERDPRVTFHPDVVVEPTARQWLAGRDPALAAALSAPFARARAVH